MTLEELYKDFPELEEIAQRLDDSEKESKKKNSERDPKRHSKPAATENFEMTPPPGTKPRKTYEVNPEHAKIEAFYKDGRWNHLAYTSKPGRKEFESTLLRVVDTRSPQAIRIKIYPSARELTVKYEKAIWLNKAAPTEDFEKTTKSSQNDVSAIVSNAIDKLKTEFQEQNRTSPAQGLETQIQIMRMEQASALKEIEHKHEIDKLCDRYEKEIQEKDRIIESLETEIEDLELELAEVDENLDGIEEKIEQAKTPDWLGLAGKVLKSGIEHLAKDNTKFIGDFLGVPESELIEYFKTKEDSTKKIETPSNSASYEAVTETDPFANLPEEKRKYAENLVKMVSAMSVDDLRVLITVLDFAISEDMTLNREVADAILKAGLTAKQEQNKQNTQDTE